MGPAWDPPGSCRPQMGPCWPHEPCYLGKLPLKRYTRVCYPCRHTEITQTTRQVTLAAMARTTILVPYCLNQVTALHSTSGTRALSQRELQVTDCKAVYRSSSPNNGHRELCHVGKLLCCSSPHSHYMQYIDTRPSSNLICALCLNWTMTLCIFLRYLSSETFKLDTAKVFKRFLQILNM